MRVWLTRCAQVTTLEGGRRGEWSTEGIQVGGRMSAVGVLGMWTGALHERMDPLGRSLSLCLRGALADVHLVAGRRRGMVLWCCNGDQVRFGRGRSAERGVFWALGWRSAGRVRACAFGVEAFCLDLSIYGVHSLRWVDTIYVCRSGCTRKSFLLPLPLQLHHLLPALAAVLLLGQGRSLHLITDARFSPDKYNKGAIPRVVYGDVWSSIYWQQGKNGVQELERSLSNHRVLSQNVARRRSPCS